MAARTIILQLQSPTGAALGSPITTTITVSSPGALQFSSGTSDVTAGSNATLPVQRVSGSDGAVGVHYATSDGTAIAGVDYTAGSGDLNWADADAANKTVPLVLSNRTARQFVVGSRQQFSTTNLRIYNDAFAYQQSITTDSSVATAIAAKSDNSQLVVFKSGAPRVKVYNPNGWAALADPSDPPVGSSVVSARYSADNSRLAAVGSASTFGSGPSRPWRIYDTTVLPYVAVASPAQFDTNHAAVAWSPTQPRLLLGTNNAVYVIDTAGDAYTSLGSITGGTNANVASIDYSPDGLKAAVAFISISGTTSNVRVYNTADWSFSSLADVSIYTTAYGVRFSNDGAHLAVSVTVGVGGSALLIYRVSDMALIQTLVIAGAMDAPAVPAWRNDDAFVAVGVNANPYVKIYDTSTDPYTPVTFAPSTIPPGIGCIVEWAYDTRVLDMQVTLSSPAGGATLGSPTVNTVEIGP